jgi:hypothetical protein
MKKKAILIASIATTCACASAPHLPKGPPPEYEEPPAVIPTTAAAASADLDHAPPPLSRRMTNDASTD